MTRLDVIAGVERRECVAYRIVARRGCHVRHLGETGEDGRDEAVATWQAAMRGWTVTAEEEHFHRWVSGNETTAETRPERG